MKTAINPNFYEYSAWQKKMFVCGIDEVGRGCLAGPVVVAAAILPQNCTYPLTDSKKMTARARDKAFYWITQNCRYSVALADASYIEQHNIYQATLFCMRKVCLQLASRFPTTFSQLAYITVDAMPLTLPAAVQNNIEIASFIKGEEHSRSIAAASIVAKVTRDRLMIELGNLFPRYSFAKDKAYASPTHRTTLQEHAATFIHRPQFVATTRTPREQRVKKTKGSHGYQQKNIF